MGSDVANKFRFKLGDFAIREKKIDRAVPGEMTAFEKNGCSKSVRQFFAGSGPRRREMTARGSHSIAIRI